MTPIKSVWTLLSSIIVHSKVDLFNHMLNSTNWRIWWNENKGNNKITELRTILQRESQNSYVYRQIQSTTGKLWKP
jgi:hypothetical protein